MDHRIAKAHESETLTHPPLTVPANRLPRLGQPTAPIRVILHSLPPKLPNSGGTIHDFPQNWGPGGRRGGRITPPDSKQTTGIGVPPRTNADTTSASHAWLIPGGSLEISVVDPLRFHFDTLRTQYRRYDRKLPRSTQPALALSHGQSQ